MPRAAIDLTGQVFGRLKVLHEAGRHGYAAVWLCECECGIRRGFLSNNLRRGISRSCGCLARDVLATRATIHGHAREGAKSPTYRTWEAMHRRVLDPKAHNYPRYGGAGITIDPRWNSFPSFLADMGERPVGKTLDRIDPNGNYETANCRWCTPKEQARNRRQWGSVRRG